MSGTLLVAWVETPVDTGPVLPKMPAKWSQVVVDSCAVNIQPTFSNEYQPVNYPKVKQLLADLGIKMVRGQAPVGGAFGDDARAFYRELFVDLGIGCHWTSGIFIATDQNRADLRAMYEALDPTAKAAIHSLGGYNEPNGARTYGHVIGTQPGETPWDVLTLTHQRWLSSVVTGQPDPVLQVPGLDHVIVCGPSLHDHPPGNGMTSAQRLQDDYLRLGPCAPFMQRINMHRYPGGQRPSSGIDERTEWAQAGVGVLPVVVTECGYNNGMGTSFVNRTPPAVIGIYADRLLAEHLSRTSGTTTPNTAMWFELLNNAPPTSQNNQNFYGMVAVGDTFDTGTWVPMPAYHTIRRYLARFADPGSSYAPVPLGLEITPGAGTGTDAFLSTQSDLWGKRDGSYQLQMWRDLKIWNTQTQTQTDPPPVNIDVAFEDPKTINVYRPSQQDAPIDTTTASNVTVALDAQLLVLDIAA